MINKTLEDSKMLGCKMVVAPDVMWDKDTLLKVFSILGEQINCKRDTFDISKIKGHNFVITVTIEPDGGYDKSNKQAPVADKDLLLKDVHFKRTVLNTKFGVPNGTVVYFIFEDEMKSLKEK